MWFPTDMAVFDFTVKIIRFGAAERARPLIGAIAETLDRLGTDHLLADLNRDGLDAWSEIYVTDPIVISGSTPMPGAFEERVLAAARELLPEAEVGIDWDGHNPVLAAVAEANLEVERVARVFGGLGRGAVPARVRLAILNTEAYLDRFGYAHADADRQHPAELTRNALYNALGEVGAAVGIGWKNDRRDAERVFGDLRGMPETVRARQSQDYTGFVDRWVAADEAELAAADPTDALYAETEDHLHTALFDAIREALSVVPADCMNGDGVMLDAVSSSDRPAGEYPAPREPAGSPGRRDEIVVGAPPARSSTSRRRSDVRRATGARLRERGER